MSKVIDQKTIKLFAAAALCNIVQGRGKPWSDYLAGMEFAFMSMALETMLVGDIRQQLTAEIGDGLEQCQ